MRVSFIFFKFYFESLNLCFNLKIFLDQRAMLFGEQIDEMDRNGNEGFWQVLCRRTLVTERAVGEEALYVFVSMSLLNGMSLLNSMSLLKVLFIF